MPRTLSDILRRYRPTVAPGPASPAGVPADRVAEAAAELAVVFVELEPTVEEAERVREQARAEAAHRRLRAVEEADRVVADARSRLDAVRAEAYSAHLAALDKERAKLEGETREEADRVRNVAAARLAKVVAQVVDGVWATAGLPPGGTPLTGQGS